jgi:D-alanyl-D-alanine carboxypeptidase/D-alanyl-D-alanine-endopeptidase (penicillin-binding protein 4)
MKKYLLSLVLSLLFIPVTVWGQNTAAKGLSSRLDTLIKYQLLSAPTLAYPYTT